MFKLFVFCVLFNFYLLHLQINHEVNAELPEFICMDGSVLNLTQVCNGKIDCLDNSDETKDLCYHIICPKNMYRCHYGACIPLIYRCDGKHDCVDKSDESQCGRDKNSCNLDEFRCVESEKCVKLNLLCDGNMDCQDGSDESKTTCEEFPCPTNSYHCRHGGCIHLNSRCDGFPDCIDGSDESKILCQSLKCSETNCAYINNLKCPAITSERLSAVCEVNSGTIKGLVKCNQPVPINTLVRYECKNYYKPSVAYINNIAGNSTQMLCQPDGTWNRDILKCEPDCGKYDTPAIPLIVHGKIAEKGKWPWHATLFILEAGNWTFWCGGTLISELVVVTAAHCVWKIPVDTMHVALGKYNSDYYSKNDNSQIRSVKKFIIQPSYQDQIGNYGSDIAVIILNKSVEFNSFIRPICIDWKLDDITSHLKEYSMGTILGMGLTENKIFSDELRIIQLPVVSDKECMKSQKRDFRKYITYTSFCAGWRNGSGVCNGDSGGGLIFPKTSDNNIWVLQGIVSVSPRKTGTSFCDPHFFSVFTKVGLYTKWLSAVLNTIHLPHHNGNVIHNNIHFLDKL